ILTGLPAGNDHNALRLKLGPDRKLYLTIGDQGNNQLGNFCHPVLSQRLPTAAELAAKNYAAYEGKSLRINLDGSIPADNPKLDGVVSHVFTYGHRNPQGLDFAPDGTLYAAEHGPKTDDEVDILVKGGNYGWPHVAGFRDNKAYEFARWAEAKTPCSELRFSDLAIHPSVPREPETAFTKPMVDPIATMFTVPTGFNFQDPVCQGVHYICWPTIGISSIEHYQGGAGRIPGWDRVVMITTLKRGSLYVLPLTKDGQKAAGKFTRFFQSDNRYRDTAVSPDGRTIFIATDARGMAQSTRGGVTTTMQNPGSILAFTYAGEGAPDEAVQTPAPPSASDATAPARPTGPPPRFTAQQVADGKKAYEAYCAVCHGNNLTNGTMGTPLAGPYFARKWTGKSVHTFLEKSKTMPPGAAGSLPADAYVQAVAYILEFNGAKPGLAPLTASEESARPSFIGALP
ncbi:MAG: PQQ-dependent sugar dehydrogenase, partial [Bryobacteraceae bacterium]|nr:PQQ-dependent sugar dehydrogenase [Bryobacteraceae bacterium]